MKENVLVLSDLSVGYGHRVVASGLSGCLSAGSVTALIGRNGTGKSTLLKTLCGFLPPLGGEILWQGKPLSDYSRRELSRMVSVVLTHRPDTEMLRVREVVEMGRIPYTPFSGKLRKADDEIVGESMEMTGVIHLENRRLASLSDGERQRVMIAKALAQETPVILLDEPTAFLDYIAKVEILRLLRQLAKEEGKTILLTTHDLRQSFSIADAIWEMRDGGMTAGTPDDFQQLLDKSETF
ncbi:MAG: ABC transporter ATP-binding protein [Bacteroidaceae bacterium]|nr:ABC transporter ATP-binding protein [Bacteroidaceae bacterium]